MDKIDLIIEIANSKIDYIKEKGHAKSGCNGPYENEDSPVRNSSHWLITYSILWEITKEKKYLDLVEILANYLTNSKNYAANGVVVARYDRRFDRTNGLIGQAWLIEALVRASIVLDDCKYVDKAKEIFLLQPFNDSKFMWDVLDYDNTICLDQIYNHQLWFAASGGMIVNYKYDEKIDCMIRQFLKKSEESIFSVYEDGLIVHRSQYELLPEEEKKEYILNRKRKMNSLIQSPFKLVRRKIKQKFSKFPFNVGLEQGYHLFDLYGFALLYKNYNKEAIFSSTKFLSAVNYVREKDNILSLMKPCAEHKFNKFAFAYNSPAFEYAYVCNTFGLHPELEDELIDFQIKNLYDKQKKSFCINCNDSETLDARIYELVRTLL